MHRPGVQHSQSSGNPDHELGASQLDPAALLYEIDAGLATIEATLAELERESTQYRQRLEGISGAARLFDEAGLVSEATAMHEGQQTIAEALSRNERRHAELTETTLKLRAAREQLAPPGVDVVAQLTAAAARLEQAREHQVGPHDNGAVAARAVPQDNLDTVRVPAPVAPEQHHDTPSPLPIVPVPVTVALEEATADADIAGRSAVDADDSSGRWRTPLLVGAFLLILLAGGTFLVASLFGGQEDDDSSSRSIVPAAATDVPSLSGMSAGDASVTASASAALIDPAPTSTELPAVVMSPTPPMPTPSVPATQPTVIALGTVVERVIDSESALQTGQIDASMEYPDGARATTRILFDLGTSGGTARVAITTMYQSGAQTRTTELVMLGAQVWERVDGSSWQEVNNVENSWGQVQVFLPRIASVSEPQRDSDDRPGELHWYDAGRNADIRLQVDPESGVPAQMRQTSRDTGGELTVTYTSWNGPVQIDPPAIQSSRRVRLIA